jgi:hypothetical protein
MEVGSLQDGTNQNLTIHGEFDPSISQALSKQLSGRKDGSNVAPLVFLRPTDTSDAWFILNLLAAVPFLSSLSYGHTMEILEIANVQLFCDGEVVIEGVRRPDILCVVWEGTCMESGYQCEDDNEIIPVVWHAGDWMGPLSLQPDLNRSSKPEPSRQSQDIVAVSKEGAKVIILPMKDVNRILKTGSALYRKYMALEKKQRKQDGQNPHHKSIDSIESHQNNDNDKLLDVLQCNSVLGSLYATQKRYLESLAEGPQFFPHLSMLWKVGETVDFAYIIVAGTAALAKKSIPAARQSVSRRGSTGAISTAAAYSLRSIAEHGTYPQQKSLFSPSSLVDEDKILPNVNANSEYARLEMLLQIRAEDMDDFLTPTNKEDSAEHHAVSRYRDRFANKILRKLYSRHAYTENLVFSRGNFLCDVTRMVSGDLAKNAYEDTVSTTTTTDHVTARRARSRSSTGSSMGDHHCHTSNLIAGPQGCVVMTFPRAALVSFLENNPGILLCLLGTQAVV